MDTNFTGDFDYFDGIKRTVAIGRAKCIFKCNYDDDLYWSDFVVESDFSGKRIKAELVEKINFDFGSFVFCWVFCFDFGEIR